MNLADGHKVLHKACKAHLIIFICAIQILNIIIIIIIIIITSETGKQYYNY